MDCPGKFLEFWGTVETLFTNPVNTTISFVGYYCTWLFCAVKVLLTLCCTYKVFRLI